MYQLQLVEDESRSDCFGLLSPAFIESECRRVYAAKGMPIPFIVPVELILPEEEGGEEQEAAKSSKADSSAGRERRKVVYVGCPTGHNHQQQQLGKNSISISASFCRTLGMPLPLLGPTQLQQSPSQATSGARKGSNKGSVRGGGVRGSWTLQARILTNVAQAQRVMVEPNDVADSEVVERNQFLIESTLLSQLRVVYEGLVVAVRIRDGLSVKLRFGAVKTPGAAAAAQTSHSSVACALLADGTELYVRTLAREQQQGAKDQDKKREGGVPTCAILLAMDVREGMNVFSTSRPSGGGGGEQNKSDTGIDDDTTVVPLDGGAGGGVPSLVVSANAARNYGWSHGDCLGCVPLRLVQEAAAAAAANASKSGARQQQQQNGDQAQAKLSRKQQSEQKVDDDDEMTMMGTATEFSILAPSLLRKAQRVIVKVAAVSATAAEPLGRGRSVLVHQIAAAACCLLQPSEQYPTPAGTAFVFLPNPPQHIHVTNSLAWLVSPFKRTTTNNNNDNDSDHEVHQPSPPPPVAAVFHDLVDALCNRIEAALCHSSSSSAGPAASPLGSSSSSSCGAGTPCSNTLLLGVRGSGKTGVVTRALRQLSSVIKIFTVTCSSSAVKETMQQVQAAYAEAAIVSGGVPCVIFLDDLDLCLPAEVEGQPRGQSETNAALNAHKSQLLLKSVSMQQGCGVFTVITSRSRESLHDSISNSSLVVGHVIKVPSLSLQARKEVLLAMRAIDGGGGVVTVRTVPNDDNNDDDGGDALLLPQHASAIAAKTENYTLHDIRMLVSRCTFRTTRAATANQQQQQDSSHRLTREESAERMRRVASAIGTFAPLAHRGVTLFKTSLTQGQNGKKAAAPTMEDFVGGLKDVKKMLYSTLVQPALYPQLFSALPIKARSGILLYGPTGCGKTHILSTLVSVYNLHCIVVNGPEVLDKYIGASEQKIRDVFERAQAAAPCVLFFDEFDSIAPQRGHDNTGVTDRLVNQLLCYLDGVEGRDGVFVVGATSRPDTIDAALLRPGRLDKAVCCSMPTADERAEILRAHSLTLDLEDDVDVLKLAQLTENWTGADLAGLVSSANLQAIERTVDLSKELAALNIDNAMTATTTQPHEDNTCNKDEGDTAVDDVSVFGVDEEASANLKARLTEKKSQQQQRKNGDHSGAKGSAATAKEKRGLVVSMSDFEAALLHQRPSISSRDIKRNNAIFAAFQGGKSNAVVPGQRATMA